MIAKIIPNKSNSGGFYAVRYNVNKIDQGRGELLKLKNFPAWFDKSTPEVTIRNYFVNVSNFGKTKNPQLHAIISAKNTSHSKDELLNASEKWIEKMGYSKQPYIVIFHNDTDNNHVHVVTTRVDVNTGNKINDSNEKYRSLNAMREIMKLQQGVEINRKKPPRILNYSFGSEGQLISALDKYWIPYEKKDNDIVVKWNNEEFIFNKEKFNSSKKLSKKRRNQLRAIFHKYKTESDINVFKIKSKSATTYYSQFQKDLKDKLGLEIIFHKKNDRTPFGYSIIDHKEKSTYKGSDVMKMRDIFNFTDNEINKVFFDILEKTTAQSEQARNYFLEKNDIRFMEGFIKISPNLKSKDYLLNWKNYQNANKYLNDYNLDVLQSDNKLFIHDKASNYLLDISKIKGFEGFQEFLESNEHSVNDLFYENTPVESLSTEQLVKLINSFTDAMYDDSYDINQKKKKRKKKKGIKR